MCSDVTWFYMKGSKKKVHVIVLPQLGIVLAPILFQRSPDSGNTGLIHNSIHDGCSHQT